MTALFFAVLVLLHLVQSLDAATPFLNTYLDEQSRNSMQKVFEKALTSKVELVFV